MFSDLYIFKKSEMEIFLEKKKESQRIYFLFIY